jgi:hypothetical protein
LGEGEEERELAEVLRRRGLTERQVEAGLRYYERFASKFDIPPARAAKMIVKMVKNMRRAFEGA